MTVSVVQPYNEQLIARPDPYLLSIKMAEINSITFDTATASFGATSDVVGVLASGVQAKTFTILYANANKTQVTSIVMS